VWHKATQHSHIKGSQTLLFWNSCLYCSLSLYARILALHLGIR